jgi:hypothetical protein
LRIPLRSFRWFRTGFFKSESRRIQAISPACGFRAVIKDVTKMCIAAAAEYFHSLHRMAPVFFLPDIFPRKRRIKAGPSGSRIILGVGAEQCVAAADTSIYPLLMVIPVLARKGFFCSFQARNPELLGTQLFFPFHLRFDNFFRHNVSLEKYVCLHTESVYPNSRNRRRASDVQLQDIAILELMSPFDHLSLVFHGML